MKYLAVVLSFVSIALFTSAQEVESTERVKAISDSFAQNCGAGWGEDEEKAQINYSLYREFAKQKNWKDAYQGWEYLLHHAPGAAEIILVDGVKIYEYKAEQAASDEEKEAYIDTLLALYDLRGTCFGMTPSLKMYNAYTWYKYRQDNIEYVFNLFNDAYSSFESEEGSSIADIKSFFLKLYIVMALKAHYTAKVIDEGEVFDVYQKILQVVDANQSSSDAASYNGAAETAFEQLDKYNMLDCEKVIPVAEKMYNDNPEDLATLRKVFEMLKGAKCYDAAFLPVVVEKILAMEETPSPSLARFLCKKYAESKDYTNAIVFCKQAAELEEDIDQKAQDLYTIAQFYQLKGDYSTARNYAYKAAEAKPGWGSPYLLIGKLYASSGKRCDPSGAGTGFDAQVVVWPAIDKFQYAKSLDPGVAAEAQTLINKYWGYMPSKNDCFFRSIQEGSTYTVGCWINETTTVRCANE